MRKGFLSFAFLVPLLVGSVTVQPARGAGAEFRKAHREYQFDMKRVAITEAKFWKESSRRFRQAYDTFRAPWEKYYGDPDAPSDIFYDLSEYRKLYAEVEAIEKKKGDAAEKLASVDCVDTATALFKQLGAITARIVKIEKQLKNARAVADGYLFDQEPSLRRVGHQVHLDGLVGAIGNLRSDEVVAWLADKGWKEACAADKRGKGVLNRVAIIDAVACIPTDAAFGLVKNGLEEAELHVRIAALEGMSRFKDTKAKEVTEASLEALRDEKAFPTKITALRILKAMKPAGAIGPLIDLLEAEVEAKDGGIICGHILKILKEFTGKDFGLNWINWKGWFGKHKGEIEGGTFKPGGPEGKGDGQGAKKMKTVSFYNIPTYSKGIIILIDASDTLIIPADIEIARKRNVFYWLEASKKKLEKYKSQLEVLKEEARKTVGMMDRHTLFNVILLYKDNRKDACWPKMMPALDRNKKRALKKIEEVKAGGWAPQYAGLLDAFKIAGLDPTASDFDAPVADTFYLLTDGGICGGRYMTPRAINKAVQRLNRFRNVTIHTVQIADLGPDAVEFLKGLADVTGGKYIWRKK